MQKKVLSEIDMYVGSVDMPKDWDIDREQLAKDILISNLFKKQFPFSITWDMLNKYFTEHFRVQYNNQKDLVVKKTWGAIYYPHQKSEPLLEIDPVDLKNSPDYVFLYGVKIAKNSCFVRIFFDENRRAGRSWDVPINDNTFVMFPATQRYFISENKSDELNFIQTITYEYI